MYFFAAVVDETRALGSDGESVDVSPSTSDQCGVPCERHTVNVKMRQKPTRRWSEVCFVTVINVTVIL